MADADEFFQAEKRKIQEAALLRLCFEHVNTFS